MDKGQRRALQGLIDRDGAKVTADKLGVDVATLGRWMLLASEPSPLAQEKINAVLAKEAVR